MSAGSLSMPRALTRATHDGIGGAGTTRGRAAAMAVPLGLVGGACLVAAAYADAAARPSADFAHFHLFWLGMLLAIATVFLRLCAGDIARGERVALVVAIGVFDYLPKYLRSPNNPLYHDELAHWRQSEVTYATGKLFGPNPTIPILRSFPGLHALTVSLRDLSGLGTFQIGVALAVLLHAIALVGIFVLAEQIGLAARCAALAAFLYSVNPSFLFFDAEYAYESLGIVLCIWVVVAMAALQGATERERRVSWFIAGLLLMAACTVTHHLSSYVAVFLIVLIAAVTTVRAQKGRETCSTVVWAWLFAAIATSMALAWMGLVATDVWAYLTPYLARGSAELDSILHHQQGARQLFAQSLTPGYERLCAYLAPPIVAVAAVAGLYVSRRRGARGSAARALLIFGLLYFPSVPFVLTQAGNEGARRSWAFTYIGLSLLIAPAIPRLFDAVARRGPALRTLAHGATVALLAVVLVGNVSAFTNETYRFPGSYVYGSDVRSLTPELLSLTAWLRDTQGANRRVVADRFSGLALASFGNEWVAAPSSGFPAWRLYFSTRLPGAFLLRELQSSGYAYMVVDRRMARYLPRIGVYFEPDEPLAYRRKTPPPIAALDKYERLPWTIKIYQSDNLAVYRFDFGVVSIPWRQRQRRPLPHKRAPLPREGGRLS